MKKFFKFLFKLGMIIIGIPLLIGIIVGINNMSDQSDAEKKKVEVEVEKKQTQDNYEIILKKRLAYLNDIEEVSHFKVDHNTVYVYFKAFPSDWCTIIKAAAWHGNKAIDFGCHVWAMDANNPDSFLGTATVRHGKHEKRDCK